MADMRLPKPILALAAIIIGAGLTWLWHAGAPEHAYPVAAIPQFEQFTQRNTCGDQRSTQHATMLLRAAAPAGIVTEARWIEIADPALTEPLRLQIEPSQADGAPGSYRYPQLFGKAGHEEQWRPYCQDGNCAFSIIYYANELAPAADYQRDIILTLGTDADETGESKRYQAGYYRKALPPRATTATGAAFVPIEGAIDEDRLSLTVTPTYKADSLIKFQIEDAAGKREVEHQLPSGAIGTISASEPLQPPVTYAAGFVLTHDATRNRTLENKLELANSRDSFFSCKATSTRETSDAPQPDQR